ncbi:MAG: hypothetical protein GXY92_03525 [Syntrophomonadaceae bacterium]|nr:hypothetical protein [Syntrophomonadaceae bacterium]
MMKGLFQNIKADLVYRVWADQAGMVPTFIDLDALIAMYIPAGILDDGTSEPLVMSMTEKAIYEIYDLGKPFPVPDVSQAKDLSEYFQYREQV